MIGTDKIDDLNTTEDMYIELYNNSMNTHRAYQMVGAGCYIALAACMLLSLGLSIFGYFGKFGGPELITMLVLMGVLIIALTVLCKISGRISNKAVKMAAKYAGKLADIAKKRADSIIPDDSFCSICGSTENLARDSFGEIVCEKCLSRYAIPDDDNSGQDATVEN